MLNKLLDRYQVSLQKEVYPSISGTRLAREEFDPTKEHDEMLTRLSEIKTLRGGTRP